MPMSAPARMARRRLIQAAFIDPADPEAPGGGGTLVVTDDFNEADNAGIGADLAWTMYAGQFKTVGNAVQPTAVNTSTRAFETTSVGTGDMYAQALLINSPQNASSFSSVFVRCDPAAQNFYMFEVWGTNSCRIYRIDAGVATILASGTVTRPTTCTLKLAVVGQDLEASIDGTVVLTATDTGSALTGTVGGLGAFVRSGGATSEIQFDNFEAGPAVLVGGGGGTPPPPPPPGVPAMPTTAKNSTWQLQWSQDFNTAVAEGGMAASSAYTGAPAVDDVGKGKFAFYTYPAYKDTRSKHIRHVTITTVAGSNIVTSSGGFSLSEDSALPYLEIGSATSSSGFTPPTQFSGTTPVRVNSVQSTSQITVSRPATTSGTFLATLRADFGYYDEGRYSVSGGICKLHIGTTSDGRHHVGALRPKLNNGGTGTTYNVLGGRFTVCLRVPVGLPGYKVAWLLWPESNTSNPDGEIDFPEQNITGTQTAKIFEHWQGGGGQSSGDSGIDIVDSDFHIASFEWRPNPTTPSLSTLKAYMDDMTTPFKTFTGALVPNTPMHWVLQTETLLEYGTKVPDSTDGYLELAWATWEKMV